MIKKIFNVFLDLLAGTIIAGLVLLCLHLFYTLYITPLGSVVLSFLGIIIGSIWALHRLFTKRK